MSDAGPIPIILVGGFLGAGKTTLLARSAEQLARQGKRVGLITNDQAAGMVDTEILRQAGFGVGEVSGGCFCCAFNRLLYACDQLIEAHHPTCCSASRWELYRPVGHRAPAAEEVLRRRFALAPFTVLADPDRLRAALAGRDDGLGDDVHYIFRKQLEEATSWP